MGLFKKKNKEEEEKKKVNKAEYKIVILEKLGGTAREITDFDAYRFRDEEDDVVYLKSDKQKFLEIFPQQMQDFKNYTEKEVDELINKNQKILENERHRDTDTVNDKGVEFDLLKLKAKKRSFKFNPNSDYLSFKRGQPCFYFIREGSTFHPIKWDLDTKTIYTPSDNRKKSASLALRNKQNKYGGDKMINGLSLLLVIASFIMACGGGYFLYKSNETYSNAFEDYEASEIAQANRLCLENAGKLNQEILKTGQIVSGIAEDVEADLNKPQTIISGVLPE